MREVWVPALKHQKRPPPIVYDDITYIPYCACMSMVSKTITLPPAHLEQGAPSEGLGSSQVGKAVVRQMRETLQ